LGNDFDCAQEVLTLMGGWIREHISTSDKAFAQVARPSGAV